MPITLNECEGCGDYPDIKSTEPNRFVLYCARCDLSGQVCYATRNVIGTWEYRNTCQPTLFGEKESETVSQR